MRTLYIALILCLINVSGSCLATENKKINFQVADAFLELMKKSDVSLLESSHCKGLLNEEAVQTVGELVAGFLAMPSENIKNKYMINSSCKSAKYEVTKNVIDIWDCRLTITEEVTAPGGGKEHIIATMMFSLKKSNKSLITDSLRCF